MQFIYTNINTVHAALMDSFWGFKECAAVVPDSRLKEKFEKIAFERQRMIRELEIRAGATKSTSGSVKGSLTRTWTKIKSSISSGGIQHVLDDLAQEEASLRKTYDNALKSPAVDSALNGLLITHLRNIECHLSELRIICGEAKYSHKWDISTPSPTEVLKEKLQTTGHTISSKLSTTGAILKDKMVTTGGTIKDKLGLGQTQTTDTETEQTTTTTTSTGQNIKAQLQATGTAIKDKMASTGETISTKFSSSGPVIKDKLGLGQTDNMVEPTVNDTDTYPPTTGELIKDKLQTTGTSIKENLQTTGTSIKNKAQATGTTIKDKLGMGQTTQTQTDVDTAVNYSEVGRI